MGECISVDLLKQVVELTDFDTFDPNQFRFECHQISRVLGYTCLIYAYKHISTQVIPSPIKYNHDFYGVCAIPLILKIAY